MYILGATEAGELVFVEFRITHRNGYPEFTASFNGVRPFTEEGAISPEEYFESLAYDVSEARQFELMREHDLSPSELTEFLKKEFAQEHIDNYGSIEIQDYIDCSLYPEIVDVDGEDYYFESVWCGQHDTRMEMLFYVDNNLYYELHELWDNYHLKQVDDDVIQRIEKLQKEFEKIDEESWVKTLVRLINHYKKEVY